MHIFHIPSWFPNELKKSSGCFFKAQIEGFATKFPENRNSIFLWGHSISIVQIRNLKQLIKTLTWRFKITKKIYSKNGALYLYSPSLIWPNKFGIGGYYKLKKSLIDSANIAINQNGKIDVIHGHACYPGGYLAALLSDALNVPYILSEHMGPFPFPVFMNGGKLNKNIKYALDKASIITAVSENLKNEISRFGYKDIKVLHNPVSHNFCKNLVSTRKKDEKNFNFLCVASLSEIKKLDILIKSFSELYKENKFVTLQIIGAGPLFVELKGLSNRLNLNKCLKFVGEVNYDEIQQYYLNSNCFVLVSESETFGLSFCEALLCGKPIISTPVGIAPDLIKRNCGVLVDIGDIKALTNAMRFIIKNYSDYKPITLRRNVLSLYGEEIYYKKLSRLYAGLNLN